MCVYSYDLVHFGHANSLRQVRRLVKMKQLELSLLWDMQAKNLGNYLLVGVHTDGTCCKV